MTDDDDPGFELIGDPPPRPSVPVAYPVADENLAAWVRGTLVAIALVFVTVFGVAAWIHPYDEDGTPRTMATHTQLGMPPCNMVSLIGKPCPACGMTTSFALLMHGDLPASLRANWTGTLLGLTWLALIPWAVVSAVRGRYLFVRSGEALTMVIVVAMLVLMLGRWAAVLLT
jgi:hypothetical protein